MRNQPFAIMLIATFVAATPQLTQIAWASEPETASSDNQANRQKLWQQAYQATLDAGIKSGNAWATECKQITAFFQEADARVPRFADSVLSFGSSWKYLVNNRRRTQQRLQLLFEQNMLAKAKVEKMVLVRIEGFQAKMDHIVNQLLLKIDADLPEINLNVKPLLAKQRQRIRVNFDRRFQDLGVHLDRDLANSILNFVGREVASAAAGVITERLMSNAQSGSDWKSALGGIVAGIATDVAVQQLQKAAGNDPNAHIQQRVRRRLWELHNQLNSSEITTEKVTRALGSVAFAAGDVPSSVRQACKEGYFHLRRYGQHGSLRGMLWCVAHARLEIIREALRQIVLEGNPNPPVATIGRNILAKVFRKSDAFPFLNPGNQKQAKQLLQSRTVRADASFNSTNQILRGLASGNPRDRILAAQAAAILFGGPLDRETAGKFEALKKASSTMSPNR